ncbi:MAG TPA: alpha/beta hydrolase, partial [Arenibaculum sp.]|nr:alpha/beta hydrolase [Arenibaculum sp.]
MYARHDVPRPGRDRSSSLGIETVLGTAAVLGALAVAEGVRARAAERANPPIGRFMEVDGVRLHYLDRGRGMPIVLLHGNGSMLQDFTSCGLVDRLAERGRVIVFDRPGFGYSSRPRRRAWTASAQARLIADALRRLGVGGGVVAGHSWGTLVALALAVERPETVRGLVLMSGYYFPSARRDVRAAAPLALPGLGDALRWTVIPPLAHLMMPKVYDKLFG